MEELFFSPPLCLLLFPFVVAYRSKTCNERNNDSNNKSFRHPWLRDERIYKYELFFFSFFRWLGK